MTDTPRIAGISISREKGAPREVVQKARITEDGLAGDRHAGPGLRQVTLMAEEVARAYTATQNKPHGPGAARENVLVAGLENQPLALLDCLRIGRAVLEVTQLGAQLSESGQPLCAPEAHCAISNYGILTRVAHPGKLKVGDTVLHEPRSLRARVLTLSDRASAGKYEDHSGPRVAELLQDFGAEHGWRMESERLILADDAELLESALVQARQRRLDLVITTGGTGLGPRDITADVVEQHADRLIPGIMEFIRQKYGARAPLALLSRSVAAVYGQTLVFALPGSVKAVEEYLGEIFQVLEHILYVSRGLDPHGK